MTTRRRCAIRSIASVTLAVCAGLAGGRAGAQEFRIDAGHSSIDFDIPFMYSHVRGRFDDVRGSVLLGDSESTGVTRSQAMAVIRTASINTGSAHRDDHLRTSDFFDVERYPIIVFRSEAVSGDAHALLLVGTLTMHGHTQRVTIPCRLAVGPVHDPHNVVIAEIHGSTMIARKDFGILGGDAHNPWFDKIRSATMGDSVRVSLEVHLWEPDAANPDQLTRAALAAIDSVGIDSAVARLRSTFARDSVAIQNAAYSVDAVGQTLIARDRLRDAFTWLHAAARLLPRSVDAMVSVGRANQLLGDGSHARAWFDLARRADSLNTRVYLYERNP